MSARTPRQGGARERRYARPCPRVGPDAGTAEARFAASEIWPEAAEEEASASLRPARDALVGHFHCPAAYR